jgi:hypothetical protein
LGRVLGPQFLEIVEASDLGPEDVNDHLAGIDEDPVAVRHALDPEVALSAGLELVDQMIGDGPDVTVRTAGSDHHAIGNGCLTVKIDCHDIFGLGIVKLGQDGA